MIDINNFITNFDTNFECDFPWNITNNLEGILEEKIKKLSEDYIVKDKVAIHKTAKIENGVTLKGIIIISESCFIGANAYLRGPIFLGKFVSIGPSSEIKQTIIFDNTSIAHFNYIGNSIIGKNVNFEAGSICANHYNERNDKIIFIKYNNEIISTNSEKFGALVGDDSKIGANAVLSPGTILGNKSIIKRLELVEQNK